MDDEAPARRRMKRLLEAHDHAIEWVGEAGSVRQAIAAIEALTPALVMLDITLAGGSGFDVLAGLDARAPRPRVIFVTAHDAHAIRAFEVAAIDYLMKPVTPERLAASLTRMAEAKERPSPRREGLVALSDGSEPPLVRASDVAWIAAQDDFSEVHRREGPSSLSPRSLDGWEAVLPPGFVRVHRSAIVNLERVRALGRPSGAGSAWRAELDTGALLPVGRTRLAELRRRLRDG